MKDETSKFSSLLKHKTTYIKVEEKKLSSQLSSLIYPWKEVMVKKIIKKKEKRIFLFLLLPFTSSVKSTTKKHSLSAKEEKNEWKSFSLQAMYHQNKAMAKSSRVKMKGATWKRQESLSEIWCCDDVILGRIFWGAWSVCENYEVIYEHF